MTEKLTIRIRNWEKYQSERGQRDRSWIKMQTQLIHDPDFFMLSITDRYLWMGLLLHAGRVGPEFRLSPSETRVLLKLNRNPSFQPLIDQGFIAVEKHIEENRIERREEKRAPTARKELIPSHVELPEGINRTALKASLQHHREMKFKKLSERGIKMRANKLAKYPLAVQMAAVEEQIANGWRGVFPDKIKPDRAETDLEHNRNEIQEWLNERQASRERSGVCEPDGEGVQGVSGEEAEQSNIRSLPQSA